MLPPRSPPSRRSVLAVTLALLANPSLALATAPPDGRFIAVLDRFETGADGRLAVLVLERAGETRGRLVVPPDELPGEARHVDAVLEVVVDAGELSSARYLPETTDRRAGEHQDRFDRIAHGRCHDGTTPAGEDATPAGEDATPTRGEATSTGAEATPGPDE